MLPRENEARQAAIAGQARAARSVAQDHVLMRMKAATDWAAVEEALGTNYARWQGPLSWPPTVLVRMLILEEYADLSDPCTAPQSLRR